MALESKQTKGIWHILMVFFFSILTFIKWSSKQLSLYFNPDIAIGLYKMLLLYQYQASRSVGCLWVGSVFIRNIKP
jgi:hypothetical protein